MTIDFLHPISFIWVGLNYLIWAKVSGLKLGTRLGSLNCNQIPYLVTCCSPASLVKTLPILRLNFDYIFFGSIS
uniref:Putative secreted protein n=1 Tax=Panstrongylus lignarius TaxID=156445 RepID=A0A224XXD5_9HEMI